MIPAWNLHGAIPPFNSIAPTGADRSPYIVALPDVVLRFAITPERIEIMEGFLQYRRLLHDAGIIAGFQWLDGSFLEEVEVIRNIPPKDIDVTTFFHIPAGKTENDISDELAKDHQILLDKMAIKRQYHTDGFLVGLDPNNLEFCVQQSHYWYGVWSHQRDTFRWKGFVQIDIDPQEDATADVVLQNQKVALKGDDK